MKSKSKKDITEQIMRIHKEHGSHRLFEKALETCLRYRSNMTNSANNRRLYKSYRDCFDYSSGVVRPELANTADMFLRRMEEWQYPREIYMGVWK